MAAAAAKSTSKAMIDNHPAFVTEPKVKNNPINLRCIGLSVGDFLGFALLKSI
jgi:hypothetical protein